MKDEVQRLKRQLAKEATARKQAEHLLNEKTRDLHQANKSLKQLNVELKKQVLLRSSALKSSEERYRDLVENARDILFNISLDGTFLFINTLGIASMGYTKEEVEGTHFSAFIAYDHVGEVLEHYAKVLSEARTNDYYEFPIRHKNGHAIWVGQRINRAVDSEGTVYYSAIARDIDQRKRTEFELENTKKALEKSEIKYRSIIENMELGLLEVDNEGIITRVYDHFNEMLGYTDDELVGKVALDELGVEAFEPIIVSQLENRKKGQTGVYELQLRKKDHSIIWVLVSGAPFYDEHGEVVGSIGIHYDITNRKQLQTELEQAKQEAENAQEAEKIFLASMSHEIRTPLNAILGMSHLLEETHLDASQEAYLRIMQSSANILKHLISDILDFSKIDAGTIEPVISSVHLETLLSELIETFRVKAIATQTEWKLVFDSRVQQNVLTDPQMLSQVLINLLSNAEKFTPKGTIELRVIAQTITHQKMVLTFEVKDTGVGIPEADLPFIFERFKQARNSVSEDYAGTGLGLSISTKLVSLLGGKLEVASTEGKGTRFFFTLELAIDSAAMASSKGPNTVQTATIKGAGKRVLVVEDHPMNIRYVTELLRKWEFEYTIAHTGIEAIALFSSQTFDFILMDLHMPEMGGFEATQTIRKMKNGEHIPIIALTASTFLSKKEAALAEGMTDFLSKPFSPVELCEKLKTHFAPAAKQQTTHPFHYSSQLDQTYLCEAYGEDYSHALEMMELFLEVLPGALELFEQAIAAQAFSDIKDQAHRIKPTFTMVGLGHISTHLTHIEIQAEQQQMRPIVDEVNNLLPLIAEGLPLVKYEIERLKTYLER